MHPIAFLAHSLSQNSGTSKEFKSQTALAIYFQNAYTEINMSTKS
jgi:hypothetical protein